MHLLEVRGNFSQNSWTFLVISSQSALLNTDSCCNSTHEKIVGRQSFTAAQCPV